MNDRKPVIALVVGQQGVVLFNLDAKNENANGRNGKDNNFVLQGDSPEIICSPLTFALPPDFVLPLSACGEGTEERRRMRQAYFLISEVRFQSPPLFPCS